MFICFDFAFSASLSNVISETNKTQNSFCLKGLRVIFRLALWAGASRVRYAEGFKGVRGTLLLTGGVVYGLNWAPVHSVRYSFL